MGCDEMGHCNTDLGCLPVNYPSVARVVCKIKLGGNLHEDSQRDTLTCYGVGESA